MKLKVIKYCEALDHYHCEDESGHKVRVDFAGEFEGVPPIDLIGRTIETDSLTQFVYFLGSRVELLPRAFADVSV